MTAAIDRLAGPRAKVERARKHFDDLQGGIRLFVGSSPYEVGAKKNQGTTGYTYYFSRVDPVPLSIACMVGDVLNNLRSALDHIAYQAVSLGVGGAPQNFREIYYPIADDAGKYPALRDRRVKGARQDALEAIDATEPYKGGNDLLWLLRELNNIDKHRLLLAASSAVLSAHIHPLLEHALGKPIVNAEDDTPGREIYIGPADGRPSLLEQGQEMFGILVEHEPVTHIDFRLDVVFTEPEILNRELVLPTVQQMVEVVDQVVLSLEPVLV